MILVAVGLAVLLQCMPSFVFAATLKSAAP
jgi:hypothetical protein